MLCYPFVSNLSSGAQAPLETFLLTDSRYIPLLAANNSTKKPGHLHLATRLIILRQSA